MRTDLRATLSGATTYVANSSHVEKHEETNGGPDGDELIGHEEGDVGDGNVEEGRHQSGDDDALHPPPKVNMNP